MIGEALHHEGVDGGDVPRFVVLRAEDAADADAVELHRRAAGDRSDAVRFEQVDASRLGRRQHWRVLLSLEVARLVALARRDAHVRAGEDSAQPAPLEPRLLDPELGAGAQRVIHRRIHGDAHHDLLELVVDGDLLYRAHFCAAESHRAVSIEPARLGEVHGDVAAAEESVADHEVAGEEHGQDGNDPDPRRPFRQMDFRLGSGLLPLPPFVHVVVLAHAGTPAVFHISFGSNSRTASISSAMIMNSGVAPGPVTI